MTRVKLYGRQGIRAVEIERDDRFTNPCFGHAPAASEPLHITPNPPTPQEQVKAIIPAYKEAYTENRDRLIAYLTQGFFGNLSDGIVLSELGSAIKSEYAPRNAMSPAQYTSLIADLTSEDYDKVSWIQALRQWIWKSNERRRPPRPLIEPEGKYKVYLIDGESPGVNMLINSYEELPRKEVLEYRWQRYCNRYNVSVRVHTDTESLYIQSQRK